MEAVKKKKSAVENMIKRSEEMSGLWSFGRNDRKREKYKELENFLRDVFWAKKKKKIVELSQFGDLEKFLLAKKKNKLSGG